jgi:TonB family protein
MSLLKTSLENPPVTVPFKVRMEPYVVESLCDMARLMRDKGTPSGDISGLLFGKGEPGVRSIEALKTFVDMGSHSELVRRQRWEKAYQTAADEARNDLELSQLEIVGWFSFRTGGGLLSSDLVFHNQFFRRPEDVALIIWRDGPSQMTTEVYSKSDKDTLTFEDYRWGSVRLSADIRHMRDPLELAMRMKLSEDSYLRTYESDEPTSYFQMLKRRAEAVTDRLFGFLHSKQDEEAFDGRVRGLIGDGRLPGRVYPPLNGPSLNGPDNGPDGINGGNPKLFEPEEPPATRRAYFNPYADVALGRGRSGFDDVPRSSSYPAPVIPTPAPQPASQSANQPATRPQPSMGSWPASGSGFGTAPARVPEYRGEYGFPEPDVPFAMPSPGTGMELAHIGNAPRTGRIITNEIGGLPMLLRPPAPPKASHWPWALSIFLVCSGLVFAFLALGGLQGENGRLGQIVREVFPGTGLNLRVHNDDDRLRLSWNPRNHAVASATDATLQIFDGQLSREVHLDGRQVADGSVLYRPQTNDITFRLVVRGDQGSATGSVRLLDGLSSRQSTLDVSSPLQTASSRPAAEPLPVDPAAPALLREGTNTPGETTDPPRQVAPSALTETPTGSASPLTAYVPPLKSVAARPAAPKPSVPHYETPETIGTIQPAAQTPLSAGEPKGGATINSWDPSPVSKAKAKPRTQNPASAGFGDATKTSFVAPRPLVQIMPNVRNIPAGTLPVRTRVAVKVSVDAAGHVTAARVAGAAVNPKVAAAAISAAKLWMFDPAKSNGRLVSSEHTIVFVLPPR